MPSIIDLDYTKDLKTRLVANIDALQRGLTIIRTKKKEYTALLADPNMLYDRDYLEQELNKIIINIQQVETVIAKETARSMQCDLEIRAAERILTQHGVQCSIGNQGEHDWQILSTFPSGNWKRRTCRRCNTEERLGSGH